MSDNLSEPAATHYCHWVGTAAADNIRLDGQALYNYLDVDPGEWGLVAIDISIDGGSQTITAYGVPAADASHEALAAAIAKGRIEVIQLPSFTENPHGHADTNPPKSPAVPVTWGTELIAAGFKQFNIRLLQIPNDLRDREFEINVIGSIAGNN